MGKILAATLVKEERQENFERYFYKGCRNIMPSPPHEGATLLDLGCGQGEMARFWRDAGWRVQCVDVSENNIAKMNQLGFEAHRLDLNEPLPFKDNAYDAVTLIDVIEHVIMAEQLVKETYRILKKGGLMLLSTPNQAFYKRRLRALQGKPPDEEGYHFRFFIRRKLHALIESHGYKIEKKGSIGYYPMLNRLLLRKLRGHTKIRLPIPILLETLFAENFIWILEKPGI
jgi:2-polyprenyl-3-methyl-5-hydroxy-6-metoxy-1,4-benzoquinol methylase